MELVLARDIGLDRREEETIGTELCFIFAD
jgi:hypothetical protein